MNAVIDIVGQEAEPLEQVRPTQGRLRLLGRGGEVGLAMLDLLESLVGTTAELAASEDEGARLKAVGAAKDLALAYAKITRSIRQSVLMEEKLDAALRDRLSGLEDARRARALKMAETEAAAECDRIAAEQAEADAPRLAREAAVEKTMDRIIRLEHRGDAEEIERLDQEVAERLFEDDIEYQGYGLRPVSETVGRLCEEFGLEPDWDRWADTAWAIEEAEAGTPGSPYVAKDRGGTGECVLEARAARAAPDATGPP